MTTAAPSTTNGELPQVVICKEKRPHQGDIGFGEVPAIASGEIVGQPRPELFAAGNSDLAPCSNSTTRRPTLRWAAVRMELIAQAVGFPRVIRSGYATHAP
jgi:hypothetical protein